MKFVLDASVALKTVLKEPDSAAAIALRDDFKNQVHQLIAPDTVGWFASDTASHKNIKSRTGS